MVQSQGGGGHVDRGDLRLHSRERGSTHDSVAQDKGVGRRSPGEDVGEGGGVIPVQLRCQVCGGVWDCREEEEEEEEEEGEGRGLVM